MSGELMRRMVDLQGASYAPEGELATRPGRELAVRDSAPRRHLERAAVVTARYGGGYLAVCGAVAAVLAVAGVPEAWALVMVGICLHHAYGRLSENWGLTRRNGRRARRQRLKYQGEANSWEVRVTLSPAAAQRKMARLAPALPARAAVIAIGSTAHKPAQTVAVSRAETIAVFGVPQSVKTALLAGMVIEAPGVVLATSSRGDLYRHTVRNREPGGPVYVLDADGYGPGTTFAWDPVPGCADPAVAMRRAGALIQAGPRDPSGKDAWHESQAAGLARCALHAADLGGGNMKDVRAWVQHPDDEIFMKHLRREQAAEGWADWLDALLDKGEEYVSAASATADAALAWLDDPKLAAVACPVTASIDIAALLRSQRGSVYLVGSDRPHGGLTPYFSLFVTEFLEEARVLAEESGGRLPVPLTIVADEAATTARIDFKRWCAITAGYNITVVAGFQSSAQLPDNWGEKEAPVILTLFSTKVIAGGFTESDDLKRFSEMCGEVENRYHENGGVTWKAEPVFPAERIRLLPDFNVLVVHRNAKPVQVVITPVWNRADYRPVQIVPAQAEEQ